MDERTGARKEESKERSMKEGRNEEMKEESKEGRKQGRKQEKYERKEGSKEGMDRFFYFFFLLFPCRFSRLYKIKSKFHTSIPMHFCISVHNLLVLRYRTQLPLSNVDF